jgi:hypothetical protein
MEIAGESERRMKFYGPERWTFLREREDAAP